MLIHHYTTAEGLLGILNSAKIWATDIFYLNDQTEVAFGWELARETVTGLLDENELSESQRNRLLSTVDLDPFEGPISAIRRAHVACFCGMGDLLSQWRGYAGGVGGYSLGFDTGILSRTGAEGGYTVTKVLYGRNGEPMLRKRLADPVKEAAVAVKSAEDSDVARQEFLNAAFRVYLKLIEILPQVKAEAFKEERETRLVCLTSHHPNLIDLPGESGQKFRWSGSLVIPYIEVDLKDDDGLLPLRSLVVGPNPHPDLAESAVRRLLQSRGYDPDIVRRSNVPLRA